MIIKNSSQIKIMQQGGRILAVILNDLKLFTRSGVSTMDIERKAVTLLKKFQVTGAFLNFHGYPYNTCISLNEEIVHGLPSERIIKNGDLVSIDLGVNYRGFCTDAAVTLGIGLIAPKVQRLIKITKKSLNEAIKLIKPEIKLGMIQAKIQNIITSSGLGLVKDLTGHGIGRSLQEYPAIPNFGKINDGIILKKGMTFCLEPMVTLGNSEIKLGNDGWTIITADRSLAAHFEHTIVVTETGHGVLTKF